MVESYIVDLKDIPIRVNWTALIEKRLKETNGQIDKGIAFVLRPKDNKAGLVKEWYRICLEMHRKGRTVTKKHELGRTVYLYFEQTVKGA